MNVDVQFETKKVIHTYLRRVKEGIEVTVQVAPEVEEFFQHWGTGVASPVHLFGRAWKRWPVVPNDDPLKNPLDVWVIKPLSEPDISFDLYSVGRNITGISEAKGQNISFLRLVGASGVNGVKFIYEDVVSRSALESTAARIQKASILFYDQYIRPAHLEVMIDANVIDVEKQPWLRRG